jgi:hypothetical protein
LSVSNQALGTRSISGRESANSSAPAAASITCSECSITARASLIGLRTVLTAATAPARRVCAVHERGIELVPALGVVHRTLAGVEQRRFFHHHDRGDHGIHGAAALLQDGVAGVERAVEVLAVGGFLFRRHLPATPAPPWMTSAVLCGVLAMAGIDSSRARRNAGATQHAWSSGRVERQFSPLPSALVA